MNSFGPVSQLVKQVTTREFRVQQTVPAGVFEQRAPYFTVARQD